jgi:hypothetical protein
MVFREDPRAPEARARVSCATSAGDGSFDTIQRSTREVSPGATRNEMNPPSASSCVITCSWWRIAAANRQRSLRARSSEMGSANQVASRSVTGRTSYVARVDPEGPSPAFSGSAEVLM